MNNRSVREKKMLLVVDDSEDMRILLGQILEDQDYDVIYAEDGQDALEQAQEHAPDLILMDMSMPGMNGWDAVTQLRQQPAFRRIPIVAITAHVSKADIERALAIGCTAHIGKPFDIMHVLDTVASLLEQPHAV